MVQFYHPNKPTGLWPLGLVVDVREGRDGARRKFLLRTDCKMEFVRGANGVVKIPWPPIPKSDSLCHPRGGK